MRQYLLSATSVFLVIASARAADVPRFTPISSDAVMGGAGCEWRAGKSLVAATDYGTIVIGINGAQTSTKFPQDMNAPNMGANDFSVTVNDMSLHFSKTKVTKPMKGESEVEASIYTLTVSHLGRVTKTMKLAGSCGA